jgi:hypothetical protein
VLILLYFSSFYGLISILRVSSQIVVHCGVQLEAVLGIFRGLEGKCQRFFIAVL